MSQPPRGAPVDTGATLKLRRCDDRLVRWGLFIIGAEVATLLAAVLVAKFAGSALVAAGCLALVALMLVGVWRTTGKVGEIRWRPAEVELVLSPAGIAFGEAGTPVPWRDIAEVRSLTFNGRRLQLVLAPGVPAPDLSGRTTAFAPNFGSRVVEIWPRWIDAGAGRLADVVEAYRAAHGGRRA